MQYTRLGSSGLIVSRLAFGAMTFTQGNRDLPTVFKVDATLADRLVGMALDAGVNFFDTADAYADGESESLLGRTLANRRHSAIVATKVGFRSGPGLTQAGLSRRHIMASAEASLRRLRTDWIDVYIVHKEDPYTPIEETLSALDDLVRSGKVRYLGFSNWSAWKAAAALEIQKVNRLAPFTHGQMHYSLLGRDVERDVIPMMRRYGLGLTVWSPLASGFLSGKYRPDTLNDPTGRYSGFDLLPFDKTVGFALVERMRPIAAAHGVSLAQVALAWLLAKPTVGSVILGAAKPEQLADNLGAAQLVLTADETTELDRATAPPTVYPNWFIDGLLDGPTKEALGSP